MGIGGPINGMRVVPMVVGCCGRATGPAWESLRETWEIADQVNQEREADRRSERLTRLNNAARIAMEIDETLEDL